MKEGPSTSFWGAISHERHDSVVNAKDNRGVTPLHKAAYGGSKDVAELLIAKGADVNARDNRGVTPLDCALDDGMAKLLRGHGARE